MAWTELTYPPGSLLTSTKMAALFTDLYALANGETGAPKVKTAALDTGVVTEEKIAAEAVSRPKCAPGVTFEAQVKTDFFLASAPLGWTQVTEHNDKLLRVVSGAGGGTGGAWSGVITDTVADHTHTETAHTHEVAGIGFGVVGGIMYAFFAGASGGASFSYTHAESVDDHTGTASRLKTTSAGGGNTGPGGSHSHNLNTAWRPSYIDVIVCSRN